MFYVFIVEVAIVVPLFSFFSSFFVCTNPRFAHSLFNVGLLLSSLGSSEGARPPLQSRFLAFYTDIESSRVEQQQLSPNRDNHSRNAARLFSLSVQSLRSTSIAGIFATSLSACRSLRKWTKKEIQNAPPEDRSFSWHCLHFFEESQLQLMFYVFIVEVTIVVPLFSFFSSFFVCTIPRFAHSLFNVGLLLSSLGSSEGAPPPLQSCFWLFLRISSRVEQHRNWEKGRGEENGGFFDCCLRCLSLSRMIGPLHKKNLKTKRGIWLFLIFSHFQGTLLWHSYYFSLDYQFHRSISVSFFIRVL